MASYSKHIYLLTAILLFQIVVPGLSLTDHFVDWLNSNDYEDLDFNRSLFKGGSFGGRTSPNQRINKMPIIFVHGNSDCAYGGIAPWVGWKDAIDYLLRQGYTSAEVYASSWGTPDPHNSAQQYHAKRVVIRIRKFIEAVLKYTGAKKVVVVAHSMGVTLSRKAIKGGPGSDLLDGGNYDLGPSIADKVDTFVGIAGGNWGLSVCFNVPNVPTCAPTNGFYPGFGSSFGLSQYLSDLNNMGGKEGTNVFSIYSSNDDVVGYGGLVWGRQTGQIPTQDGEIKFEGEAWTHLAVRDVAGPIVLHLLQTRKTDGHYEPLKKYCKETLGYQINTFSVKRVGGLPVFGEKVTYDLKPYFTK